MISKTNFNFLAVLIIPLSLALAGCGHAATTPAVIQNQTTAPVQEQQNNIITTQSNLIQWPSKMPTDVPVFTYGTITGSNNNIMGSIQAAFDHVSSDAFGGYRKDLTKAGWKITNATQSADGFEIDATKGSRSIVAMFIASKDNTLRDRYLQ